MKKIILTILVIFSVLLNSFAQDSLSVDVPYEIIFRNCTNKEIKIAIRYMPVDSKDWETQYWIHLQSQEEKSAFFTKNKTFCCYAKTNFISRYGV